MATSPEFLKRLEAEWPVKMANEIVIKVADKVKKLQRKAFSAVTTRVQSQKIVKPCSTDNGVNVGINKLQPLPKDQGPTQTVERQRRKLWGVAFVRLVEPKRFSSLSKLCGTVAWVRRAVEAWLSVKDRALNFSKVGGKEF